MDEQGPGPGTKDGDMGSSEPTANGTSIVDTDSLYITKLDEQGPSPGTKEETQFKLVEPGPGPGTKIET